MGFFVGLKMRITLEKALKIYEVYKVDLFDLDKLRKIDDLTFQAICKTLQVKPAQFIESLLFSLKGWEEEPQASRKGKGENITLVKLLEVLGEAGLSGFNYTPFELLKLAKGAARGRWGVASSIMAIIYNSHCTKKSHCKSPQDFNPTIEEQEKKVRNLEDFI